MSQPGAKRAADDEAAGAGGRARKAARKIGDEDEAPAAPAPAGRKGRQLRVKLTGEKTCTRQMQVRARRSHGRAALALARKRRKIAPPSCPLIFRVVCI